MSFDPGRLLPHGLVSGQNPPTVRRIVAIGKIAGLEVHAIPRMVGVSVNHQLRGGAGLFQGIELVKDRQTLEPAAAEASFIVNRMRENGILMGTEGPLHNVIKIRPPMVFSREHADRLLAGLERALVLL